MKEHENLNLLFFLNAIMRSLLDSLVGVFHKNAKYKFNKVVNTINQLEKELEKNCDELAVETYYKSSVAMASILNLAIDEYNEGNLSEFLKYCVKFKDNDTKN